jgi:hypothetical protein
MATPLVCTPRRLSPGQRATAASIATDMGLTHVTADDSLSASQRLLDAARRRRDGTSPAVIAVVRANSWGPGGARLTTKFMDKPSTALRREILRHLNMWSARANVQFVESQVDPMVRIDRRTGLEWGGYWSYVGTDILGIRAEEPTMNLEGFTMSTPASEFRRVVCHEAGHTLGFPHEHMRKTFVQRIDRDKANAYFLRTDGWSPQDVEDQVLTPLDGRTIMGTAPDQTSIMCYQLPGTITRDGKPILGGTRINETDYKFAATIYPLPPAPRRPGGVPKKAKKSAKKSTPRKSGRRVAAKKKQGVKKSESRQRVAKRGTSKRASTSRRK